jgi:hypothetical protein
MTTDGKLIYDFIFVLRSVYNWCEVRVKMWFLNMGKPDSIPPLNEQMAIELGANLLGETIVFVSAAGVLLLEYSRQVRKEETKENARLEEISEMQRQIQELNFRFESHDAQLRRVLHAVAELDSKTIRIPWKGSAKPVEDVSPKVVDATKAKTDTVAKKEENVQVTKKEEPSPLANKSQTLDVPEKTNKTKVEEKKR